MDEHFEKAFVKVIELEGGFTLHKNKTEQAVTYAGIYKKAHPSWEGWEYIDKNQTPPTHLVREFYYENFYKDFEELEPNIAYILFESSVNMGATAIKLAQRTLGVVDDGVFGPKTQRVLIQTDPHKFLLEFTISKIVYYNYLAKKEQYQPYLRGWINRAVKSLEMV